MLGIWFAQNIRLRIDCVNTEPATWPRSMIYGGVAKWQGRRIAVADHGFESRHSLQDRRSGGEPFQGNTSRRKAQSLNAWNAGDYFANDSILNEDREGQ
jgi:hypothetical protein